MPMRITKVTVEKLDSDFAVFRAGEISFEVPRALLPDNAEEGAVLYLDVKSDEEAALTQEGLAKAILGEVLKEG